MTLGRTGQCLWILRFHDGENLHYSYELMDTRWTVDGDSDGWCILAETPVESPVITCYWW